MFNKMIKYLQTKKEIIEQVDLIEKYPTQKEQEEWLVTVYNIGWKEPAFLTLTYSISQYLKETLNKLNTQDNTNLTKLSNKLLSYLEETNHKESTDRKVEDDYYQWITLIRKGSNTELSTRELLRQTKLDPVNMMLFVEQKEKLVGNKDFLSTFNFALASFQETFEEDPCLLTQSKDIINEGIAINNDKTFLKQAKTTLKRIKKVEKTLEKKQVKTMQKK